MHSTKCLHYGCITTVYVQFTGMVEYRILNEFLLAMKIILMFVHYSMMKIRTIRIEDYIVVVMIVCMLLFSTL